MSMGASTVVGGPRGTTSCLRVPRAPRARWKHTTGGRALLMMSQGLGQGGRDVARDAYRVRGLSQVSDKIEFFVRALSG
jgi:hypothetical protein